MAASCGTLSTTSLVTTRIMIAAMAPMACSVRVEMARPMAPSAAIAAATYNVTNTSLSSPSASGTVLPDSRVTGPTGNRPTPTASDTADTMAVALIVGVILFPVGPVTLLSGTTVSLGAGLVRVLLVTLYVCAAMAALGAIGLAVSTFTEHAIGAIAAIMILVVTSEVVDNVPQLAAIGPYLPTHWWLSFDSILRAPVDTSSLLKGLLSFGVYTVLFGSFAWARFTSADVTS